MNERNTAKCSVETAYNTLDNIITHVSSICPPFDAMAVSIKH
jgi:hypothetical protein